MGDEALELSQARKAMLRMMACLTKAQQSLDDGRTRRNLLREVKNAMKEAENILQSMDLAALNTGKANELKQHVTGYRKDLAALQKEYAAFEETAQQKDREELLGRKKDEEIIDLDAVGKQNEVTSRISKTSERLRSVELMGSDILDTGSNVLSGLNQQREQIQNSRMQLGGINSKLGEAKSVMNEMWARAIGSAVLRYALMVILVLAIILILYFKFLYRPSHGVAPIEAVPPPANNHSPTPSPT